MTTTSSTNSTSTTQSLISALGGGSGIDMTALANNLATAEFAARTDRLTSQSDTLNAKISSASNLKSVLLNLSTAMGDAVRNGSLSPTPQVTSASVAKATLSSTRTPTGTFTLEVTALAKSQSIATQAVALPSTPVGSGTLTLRFGTIANGSFAQDTSHAAVPITIPAGAKLSDVAASINAAKAGVTAYVASTDAGAQLVLKGAEGAANGFVLDAAETASDPGLAQLAWSPSGSAGQLLASAGDAAFKVDGLARTSASNTVSEAIPGVTMTLTATNPGAPTTVTFADTSSAITSSMSDLTSALNEVVAALTKATDPDSGELRNDPGARALKRSLGQLAGATVIPGATGAARTLADLGLSTQRDGTFVLDTKRLADTIAKDPAGVSAMFTNGLYGVYANIDKLYRGAAASGDANSLGGSINRYSKLLKQVTTDKADLATKQETLRANLVSRLGVSETRITSSKSTLSFLQNQIAAWNNAKG